jgi:hypothetical protein
MIMIDAESVKRALREVNVQNVSDSVAEEGLMTNGNRFEF